MTVDLHALANAISPSSPAIKNFSQAVADILQPPVPPPVGEDVFSVDDLLARLATAKEGSMFLMRSSGSWGKRLVLARDFATQVTVVAEQGVKLAGLDTAGASGYSFVGLYSSIPAEFTDYNVTPFYLHGASKRISLTGCKLEGGYDCLKQYGECDQVSLTNVEAWGAGGDVTHWDGVHNATLTDCFFHDPLQKGPEHPDGIQVQRCYGTFTVTRPRLVCKIPTPRDGDGQGMFLRRAPDGVPMGTIIVDSPYIEWNAGRAFQAYDVDYVTVKNPSIPLSGNGTTSPKMTVGPSIAGSVDLYGTPSSFVYFNSGTDKSKVVWH